MLGRVLVTGASGFVGRALVTRLAQAGMPVRTALRQWPCVPLPDVDMVQVGDLHATTDWRSAIEGVDAVVHCAARVHVLHETAADPLAAFREVNVAGTLQLARQAQAAGVRRLVFISSIGVNGAETTEQPFTPEDAPSPHSPYAQSKHEAELALRSLAQATGLEVTIIRPPLVFGPGAPGNFERLMQALRLGMPLPFGAVHNQRSFVALGNLTSLVELCLDHPQAANQTFMVSDGEDISTTELLRRLALGLGRPARLFPVPSGAIRSLAGLLGKADFGQRVCGSLQIDISKTRALLGWSPPVSLADALNDAARRCLERGPL
jgi:nucleoside-diphosphate-sugar epimerase